jgi:hypothetical protein
MESVIKKGDFKAITSVLIARHGEIAYETYFDDAGTRGLRSIRSATKTITGMLIGAAIDRKLISSVRAHVRTTCVTSSPFKILIRIGSDAKSQELSGLCHVPRRNRCSEKPLP